jgi:hypothetical protein
MKTTFWLFPILVLTGLFACEKEGPEPPSFGQICTWDVPNGQIYHFEDTPGTTDSVKFVARVYEATKDQSCITFDDRLHPLVIVAHGKISTGIPYNYLGMTFLTEHLASWGDIVLSLNLDFLNGLQGPENQWGIPHRGELILHAIEYMCLQNRSPGSPYFQRIDTTKIAIVGHSRGGGASIFACNRNLTKNNRPIKAVATLSPANFGTQPLIAPVPHLCLYGSWDGDLFEGEGPDLWSRGTRSADRELVEIYGANHYYFTDKVQFPAEEAGISREDHHLIAKGMVNAWLDRYLREQNRYDWAQYLDGSISFRKDLDYFISIQNHVFLPIHNPTIPNERSTYHLTSEIRPQGACTVCAVELQEPPDYCIGGAVQASWDQRREGLNYHFPSLDASEFAYLSFRISQVHGDSLNLVDQRKDFHVILQDSDGKSAKIRATNYLGGLQYPDLSGSLPPDDPNNRKQIMRGFRIPMSEFKGVNTHQLTTIRIAFDCGNNKGFDNISGTVKVADLEFSN